jgi:hypothetical protein
MLLHLFVDVAEGENPDEAEEDDECSDPQGEADDDDALPSDDEEGRQESGGVYVGEDLPRNHDEKLTDAWKGTKEMLGETTKQGKFTWEIISKHHADDLPEERFISVKDIELHRADPAQIYSDLLLHIQRLEAHPEEDECKIPLYSCLLFIFIYANTLHVL